MVETIERLTGKQPCPTALKGTLNKYLYQEQLFEGAISDNAHDKVKKLGKLRGPATDNLVRNLLDLDPLFGGDTVTVIKVVTKTLGSPQRAMDSRWAYSDNFNASFAVLRSANLLFLSTAAARPVSAATTLFGPTETIPR